MPETLLSPSQIKLFGRDFEGLTLNKGESGDRLGKNNFLLSKYGPGCQIGPYLCVCL